MLAIASQSEPEPNWERLHEEVFSHSPADICEKIWPIADGVNVYVLGSGAVPPALKQELASEWLDEKAIHDHEGI